jgi:glycosyltransferase involved in cell wall biosynthesis
MIMLHVIQTVASLNASKGGVTRTVTQLSKALASCPDMRVSIVSADTDADLEVGGPRTAADAPVPGLARPVGSAARVRRLAEQSEATAILVHDNGLWLPSNLQAALGARRGRLPLIISPHGMLEPWALNHRALRKRAALATYQGWCLRSAIGFHATSPEEATSIRRAGLRQPIALVGNGIESPPKGLKRTYDRTSSVLFLSRLHAKKGVLELIAAWQEVRPLGWSLRIVGPDDGGYRERVVAAIYESGAADSIALCDEVDDAGKWRHYAEARLFILPSFSENFGLVIGEALASGLPVITTTATPWAQIGTRGCGWIIEPTVDAIAAALQAATSLPPAELENMGNRGRDWIPAEFSWPRIAAKMQEFYGWVARGCAPPERPGFVHLD